MNIFFVNSQILGFALILFGLFVQGKQKISLRIVLNLKIASIKDFKKNFFFVVDLIEKKKYDLD